MLRTHGCSSLTDTPLTLTGLSAVMVLAMLASFAQPRIAGAQPRERAQAQETCRAWAKEGMRLAGRVEDREVRVFLRTGHPAHGGDGMAGVLLYPESWTPDSAGQASAFGLLGTLEDGCRLRLKKLADDGSESKTRSENEWDLRLVAGKRWQGTSVDLHAAAPVDCTGKGKWRTFTSPRWPIVFDYPASWRLVEQRGTLILQCPDPATIADGTGAITFRTGAGRKTTDPDNPQDSLTLTRRSQSRDMTVLQGSVNAEHRLYAPGFGYIGLGPGITRYLVQLAGSWTIIDSEETTGPSADGVDIPGPVTKRIVRNVKPR